MKAKNTHNEYGKKLFADIFKERWKKEHKDTACDINIRFDGLILSDTKHPICAVEIVAGGPKQVTGALINLFLCDEVKKKLLVLIPVKNHPGEEECRCVWRKISPDQNNFEVISLIGTGYSKKEEIDIKIIKEKLQKLDLI